MASKEGNARLWTALVGPRVRARARANRLQNDVRNLAASVAEKAGGRHIPKSAAFKLSDDDGNGHIYLLAECKAREPEQREAILSEVSANVRQTVGAPIEVVLVPLRSLIMTSSGKLSRMRTRQKFISGAFELESAVPALAE